jgi:hypothetical protein
MPVKEAAPVSQFASVIEFLNEGGDLRPDSLPILAGMSFVGKSGNTRVLVAVVGLPEPPLESKSKKILMEDGIKTFQYPKHTVLLKVVRLRRVNTPLPEGMNPLTPFVFLVFSSAVTKLSLHRTYSHRHCARGRPCSVHAHG